MLGYLEEIPKPEAEDKGIPGCFVKKHGDSRLWLPGKEGAAHEGLWMRLVVEQIYWIGGFGDRAFIGWFTPQEWRDVEVDEWKSARLPGEP